MENSLFKKNHPLAERKEKTQKILQEYPDRVPVIVEKDHRNRTNELPDINKEKYLVPRALSVGSFLFVIRKKIQLSETQALYLMINGTHTPMTSDTMGTVYDLYKDEDGYLYIVYSTENTFGQ